MLQNQRIKCMPVVVFLSEIMYLPLHLYMLCVLYLYSVLSKHDIEFYVCPESRASCTNDILPTSISADIFILFIVLFFKCI